MKVASVHVAVVDNVKLGKPQKATYQYSSATVTSPRRRMTAYAALRASRIRRSVVVMAISADFGSARKPPST